MFDQAALFEQIPAETLEAMRRAAEGPRTEYRIAPVPQTKSLSVLRDASKTCDACPWACHDHQTVFGEGPKDSAIMFVGEQPGDVEDRQGHPFVGPAGAMFDAVLDEIELDRHQVYVTNAVKHFKFKLRGKRRVHQTLNARDINTCKPWLLTELEIVKPKVLVCLGAIASKSLFGSQFKITTERGHIFKSDHAPFSLATWHPSALLRAPDEVTQKRMRREFTADITKAWRKI